MGGSHRAVRAPRERILGVDPGTASTGFGVVDRDGTRLTPVWYDTLRTSAKDRPETRLLQIQDAALEIIERFTPDCVALEDLYFGAGARAALAVGQARGVIIATCARAGLSVHEYTVAQIKMSVTGYGRADKLQVQTMVQTVLKMHELPRPDHSADALAAAICHAGSFTLGHAALAAR